MTTIPDDIMKRARDLAYTGCGCDEVEAQTCGHVRECLCDFQTTAIALALMAERDRALEEAAEVVDEHDGSWHPKHPFPAQAVALDLKCEEIATAIRAMKGKVDD